MPLLEGFTSHECISQARLSACLSSGRWNRVVIEAFIEGPRDLGQVGSNVGSEGAIHQNICGYPEGLQRGEGA